MIATMSLNGKPRRQLSDQLDRMDEILDVLGEGLAGAVVDAMKAGTALAVKQALVEILSNPELLATIRGGVPPATVRTKAESVLSSGPARPSLWSRLKAKAAAVRSDALARLSRVKERVVTAVKQVRNRIVQTVGSVKQRVRVVKQHLVMLAGVAQVIRHAKQILLLAIGIGTATGMMSLLAPHALAALASGVSAAVTLAGVQLGLQNRGLLRRMLPN